jgi:hypothetical protein
MPSTRSERKRPAKPVEPSRLRDRRLWLVAVLGLAVVLVVGAYWYLTGPGRPGGEAGTVILEMSGEADATSQSIFARTGWLIAWETEGSNFSMDLTGDVNFGTVVTQDGPSSGITSPVASGNFRIVVQAAGPWTITVYQGD